MPLEPRGWNAVVLSLSAIVALILSAACTKRNPDLCCATDAECTAIGFSSHAPCDLGVCVNNECTTASGACDDDTDCAATPATPFCVAGTCAACASSASCPTTDPVCDATTHDCRACVADGECESGACDLAVGTCVDPTNIRYASPTGNDTQPCSHAQPCSFAQAANTVDNNHPYIVLLPGVHTSSGFFDGTTAIICGSNASLQAGPSAIDLINGATITLRGFQIVQSDPNDENDFNAISCTDGTLTIQDMDIQIASGFWTMISQFRGKTLTIQHSVLQGGKLQLDSTDVVIDRSIFSGETQIGYVNGGHSIKIGNSLFNLTGVGRLRIKGTDTASIPANAFIHNNTFSHAAIGCDTTSFFSEIFEANIFYDTELLTDASNAPPNCNFNNNLIFPSLGITGTNNLIADPQFVNIATQDYHLQSTSPARDACTQNLTDHDHDNVPRPQGERNDIGAFEYVPSAGQ